MTDFAHTEGVAVQTAPQTSPYPLSSDNDFVLIRLFEHIGRSAAVLAALALLAMAAAMVFEIGSRTLFNEPTSWGTEITSYLLVAVVFLGLSAAQASNSHVQVELWVDRLGPDRRVQIELMTQWIALLFVLTIAWQMGMFNVREYLNDTRDWGLLSTPQWIPELSVTAGLITFALSVAVDIYRLRPPRIAWRRWAMPVLLLVLVAILIALGSRRRPMFDLHFDWGSLAIAGFMVLGILAWSGLRTLLGVLLIMGGFSVLYALAQGQSLVVVGALLALSMVFFLLFGVRIAVALGVVGMLGVYYLLSRPQLSLLGERAWSSTNTFTLTAVPMFILMGGLLLKSGIVTGMFDALVRWFGRTPGGLAHASAGASAIFAAVTGSSLATAATLGQVACPEMMRRGYSPQLTYGVTAAGATLGILIPPSIPMIIYGTTVGASVTHLFMAGMVPGIALMLLFMITALVWSVVRRGAAPRTQAYTVREKVSGSRGIVPFVLIIGAVLGSMYAGVATPTEAAAIGALAAFVLCLVRRRINVRELFHIAMETSQVTAMLLFIVVGASIFSWVVDYLRLPREIVNQITSAQLSDWVVMGAVMLAYVVLGMFIESIAMMLMTLPVTFPIAMALGLDPLWFGVFLVLMIEIGLITPPLGMVLFVLQSMNQEVRFTQIMAGVFPFVCVMLAFVVVLYFVPDLALWLPRLTP